MATGIGRFCCECKVGLSAHYYISSNIRKDNERELSKGDLNKLNSFFDNPEKYATGSGRAKAKVQYLESIKHKMSGVQVAKYIAGHKKYDAVLTTKADLEVIQNMDYSAILQESFNNHQSLKIRYKGSLRTIDPYSLDQTYVVAYCHLARDIRTFRVDRIKGAELLPETFSFNSTLQGTAQSRLKEAPSYKGYRGRRRGY